MAGEYKSSPGRILAILTAVLFVVSSIFPLAAGLAKDTSYFPKWWGRADVALAFVLAIAVFAVLGMARGNVNQEGINDSYAAYRALNHVLFAGILIFVFFGDRIAWSHCLSGFAWRTWLLVYVLPSWFMLLQGSSAA